MRRFSVALTGCTAAIATPAGLQARCHATATDVFSADGSLTEAAVREFRQKGFLIVKGIFSNVDTAMWTRGINDAVATADANEERDRVAFVESQKGLQRPTKKMRVNVRNRKELKSVHQKLLKDREKYTNVAHLTRERVLLKQQDAYRYAASPGMHDNSIRKQLARNPFEVLNCSSATREFVWHGHPPMRDIVTGPLGQKLGRCVSELTGSVRTRLFTDNVVVRDPNANTSGFSCDVPSVSFYDTRATKVSLMLRGSPAWTTANGGPVALVGSHTVIRRECASSAQIAQLAMRPPAWDTASWLRYVPALQGLPIEPLRVEPGDALIADLHLVTGHGPNMSPDITRTHVLYTIPDHVVYRKRQQPLHMDSKPLRLYADGDTLMDDGLFPVLYSAVDDME